MNAISIILGVLNKLFVPLLAYSKGRQDVKARGTKKATTARENIRHLRNTLHGDDVRKRVRDKYTRRD